MSFEALRLSVEICTKTTAKNWSNEAFCLTAVYKYIITLRILFWCQLLSIFAVFILHASPLHSSVHQPDVLVDEEFSFLKCSTPTYHLFRKHQVLSFLRGGDVFVALCLWRDEFWLRVPYRRLLVCQWMRLLASLVFIYLYKKTSSCRSLCHSLPDERCLLLCEWIF